MKKKLITIMMAFSLLLGAVTLVSPAYAATTDAKAQVCAGVSGQVGGNCNAGGADLSKIIKAVLYILSALAGIAAVIMIIVSGLRYITSGGDAQAVSGAKRSLIYAIVGLVVVAVAQILVKFVLSNTN